MRADPGQIEQVILNMAVNARDAMSSGGQLLIETRNAGPANAGLRHDFHQRYGHRNGFASPVPRLRAVLHHQGAWHGLGLATSYGIIKENGGDLRVESTPGKGTTFHIELPVTEQMPEESDSPAERRAPRGTETILLVEDEDPVRRVVETMLKRHGYQVLASASSNEALAAAEQHRGEIHLLITDIRMPGMSGRKMAECLTGKAARHESSVCFRLRRR